MNIKSQRMNSLNMLIHTHKHQISIKATAVSLTFSQLFQFQSKLFNLQKNIHSQIIRKHIFDTQNIFRQKQILYHTPKHILKTYQLATITLSSIPPPKI